MDVGKLHIGIYSLWRRKVHTGRHMVMHYLLHPHFVFPHWDYVVLALGTDVATAVPQEYCRGFEFGMCCWFYFTGSFKDKRLWLTLFGFDVFINWGDKT